MKLTALALAALACFALGWAGGTIVARRWYKQKFRYLLSVQ